VGDLRHNRSRLTELAAFILSREGFDPYFYCDSNGFVTIGIGTLVLNSSFSQDGSQTAGIGYLWQKLLQTAQRSIVVIVAFPYSKEPHGNSLLSVSPALSTTLFAGIRSGNR
jgi:hypothetical protein